ncbi:MAG: aminotransferase class V-fold PLP-dependent enzyme [Clostridiales bacterium]|jgi:cysteine desulfurase|nr:aminotransferase class V-fold PLP-dependent enzyme [Clostridiales bacterium]
MIYLDYAADTPVDAEVAEIFDRIRGEYFANPNSAHPAGKAAGDKLREYISGLQKLFGVESGEYEFIPVSSASEANNLAIKGIAEAYRENGRHIVSTCLEHSSVGGALTYLQSKGYEVELADIKRDGTVDLEHLKSLMRKDTVLVSVGYVDSEVGAIQPIKEIASIISAYPSCRLHTDATQAVGKIPVTLSGVACMSFAGHKIYGINGAACLIRHKGTVLTPLIHGGNSLSVYRSGTPSTALTASLYKAAEIMYANAEARLPYVGGLNKLLRERLSAMPGVFINSPSGASPYILNVGAEGIKGTAMRDKLGELGICVSVKSACSTPNTPSKAVYAVTGDKKKALSSIRISLSHLTTINEAEEFAAAFEECRALLKTNGDIQKM